MENLNKKDSKELETIVKNFTAALNKFEENHEGFSYFMVIDAGEYAHAGMLGMGRDIAELLYSVAKSKPQIEGLLMSAAKRIAISGIDEQLEKIIGHIEESKAKEN